jgi:RNA polymerase sigma-32 factor
MAKKGENKSGGAKRPRKPRAEPTPASAEADEPEEQAEAEPKAEEVEELGREGAAEGPALQPEVLPPEEAEGERKLPVPARDLAHADALQRYMSEVARHPLLSREEEHALAVKFRETGDPQAAYRLVTANLRLVVKIAHEYRRAAFSLLDLIQEGNVGLVQAVQKYDPFRGVKLSSYAAWWIRAYVLRYLMDNWRMVKLGTTQAQRKLFFNLRKEQDKLMREGFDPGPKLLAERLNVSEQDVREMDQRLSNDEFSLDAPVSGAEESRQTHGDRIAQPGQAPDEALADEELRRIFKEKLEAFGKTIDNEKDRYLFEHRIAPPPDVDPMTLQDVGLHFGFSRERARQLEARLLERLRDYLRRELPDFAELSLLPEDQHEENA